MVNITRLHIHYRDLNDNPHLKKIKPKDTSSTLMIKKDIASYLTTVKNDVKYYYVVVEIESEDGPKFRTIVPKTFING